MKCEPPLSVAHTHTVAALQSVLPTTTPHASHTHPVWRPHMHAHMLQHETQLSPSFHRASGALPAAPDATSLQLSQTILLPRSCSHPQALTDPSGWFTVPRLGQQSPFLSATPQRSPPSPDQHACMPHQYICMPRQSPARMHASSVHMHASPVSQAGVISRRGWGWMVRWPLCSPWLVGCRRGFFSDAPVQRGRWRMRSG
mmetsp:Transcript_41896/g.84085  ORF Transcript_41896/g.84085 Transcript_41896/m.84085 type:complete len:200 (-) Transcript_41896:55-654(-)